MKLEEKLKKLETITVSDLDDNQDYMECKLKLKKHLMKNIRWSKDKK